MGIEIERKFLIESLLPLELATSHERIRQGYLNLDIDRTVRIRIMGDYAYITVKGRNDGAVRAEFEYPIPLDDGISMLEMCDGGFIDKVRYFIPTDHFVIEFDVFSGNNLGLLVAEIEFINIDKRKDLTETELRKEWLPDWIGKEITDDARYYNSALLQSPWTLWTQNKL